MIASYRVQISAWVLLGCTVAMTAASAEWQADTSDRAQVKAAAAIDKIRQQMPDSEAYFDDAYGYAVFPSITRAAVGFGGAYGKGLVIEGREVIGQASFWQFTSGIQLGANNFSLLVFFKDADALEYFKTGEMQFAGQAGIAVGTFGALGTPAYNEGVAMLGVTRFGVMVEFSYGGIRFSYKDIADQ